MKKVILIFLLFTFLYRAASAQTLVNNRNAKETEAALVGVITDLDQLPEKNIAYTIKSSDKTFNGKGITDEDGKFTEIVPKGKEYTVVVQKMSMDYSFTSKVPNVKGPLEIVQNYVINFRPNFLRTFQMRNVYFDNNTSKIKTECLPALDSLAILFLTNEMFIAQIAGYTDNVGDPVANIRLSQKRADAIRSYLISKGIQPARIFAKGYGEKHPLEPNDTPEGRSINRRTEVKILLE